MNKHIKEIFTPIRAEEDLKARTRAYLARETRNYTKRNTQRRRYTLYAAACACLLLVLTGGHRLYFTPVAEISIDINPSLELSINRFDRVIAVTDYNEDGRALSAAPDIKYKNYTEAIEHLFNDETIASLLSANEVMTITVTGPNEQRSAEILLKVEGCTSSHHNTHCYVLSPADAAEAHESGLSCGKYRAFLELSRLDPTITPERVQGMTMREIWDLLTALTPNGSSVPNRDNCETGHGHGRGHGNARRHHNGG